MSKLFLVSVLELKKINELPDSWNEADYRALLARLEVDDVDDMVGDDLLDILLMALQDLEPEAAGDHVLAHKLENSVSAGSRQNITLDLLDGQRIWEEMSEIRLHAKIFAAAQLLNKALPKSYSRPDMMRLRLHLQGQKPEAIALLTETPEAAFICRVLADGMDEHSILERLFDEQLAGHAFPEAEGIIWLAEYSEQAADGLSAVLTVYSSQHWLHDLEDVDTFESNACNDLPEEEDDDD